MAERNTTKPAHIARAPKPRYRNTNRGLFQPGDARAVECGRKGAAVSPWGREPLTEQAQRSDRLQMIRAAAEGKPVQMRRKS